MMTTYCEPWTDHDISVEFLLQNVCMYVCMYVCMSVSLLQPGIYFCLSSWSIQNESTKYKQETYIVLAYNMMYNLLTTRPVHRNHDSVKSNLQISIL